MSLVVTIEGVDTITGNLQNLQSAIQNAGEGLLYAASETVFPAVQDSSTVVWNVRTGNYSGSWQMAQTDSMSITIWNDVDYAAALEYGWTSWHGATVESPGVLIPSALENLDALAGEFTTWLNSLGN